MNWSFVARGLGPIVLSTLLALVVTGLPAAAAEANPLAGIGGKLAYVDSSGSLIVLNGETGARQTLVRGTPDRSIWAPTWSPDGAWLAFLASPRTNTPPREDDVYVMPADGSTAARRVTQYASFMNYLGWFPNSQVLVYGTGFNGYFAVNRVNLDGQFQQVLYPAEGEFSNSYYAPSVSPDGQFIASMQMHYADVTSAPYGAFVSAADGSNGQELGDMDNLYHGVTWLPDSSGVLFPRGNSIIESALDGSRQHPLVRARGQIQGTPAVAPDGSQVAFVYDGGEILGDHGPTTEWRLAVHSLPDTAGHYWTGVNPYEKVQWVGGTQGLIFQAGGPTGPQSLRLVLPADGTLRTIAQIGNSETLGGYDWHA